ncbi:MAG: GNAT family N-acetyltransferase [Cyanobacteria bacterium P01_G01_bin.38]
MRTNVVDMQYLIRLAERSEVAKLSAIEKAAAEPFYDYLSTLELTPDKLDEIVSLPFLLRAQTAGRLWVAIVESQPVGFIVGRPLAESFFIVELDVLPSHTRLGIGTALMRTACDYAQAQEFEAVTLTTFRHVPWNIPFYETLGFKVVLVEDLSVEMQEIVEHEDRYGFKREHRAVMKAALIPQPLLPDLGEGESESRFLSSVNSKSLSPRNRDLGCRGQSGCS